jgi:tetratricopeptide (TPR) repeat protein
MRHLDAPWADWGLTMASVFLSYDREDAGKARSIATALEKGGHSVWWDRHIAGGAQYGTEIEEALERSDAVVVLWSTGAVRSAWVRDEAAAGRDAGKLVPVRLDTAEPPMGFRQYQTIDLARWRGTRNAEGLQELNRAVDNLGSQPADTKATAVTGREASVGPSVRSIALAALALGILAIGVLFLTRSLVSSDVPVVAVAAADDSDASGQLARDLYVKLGSLKATDTQPIELVDDRNDQAADFTFEIAGSGTATRGSVTLKGRDGTLLWSKDFERPPDQAGDLKQQIALSAARVLACATQAASSGGVDQQTLRIYLNGCATLSEMAWTDFRSLVPVFRQVTRKAPGFEGGWSHLLLTETYMVGWESLAPSSAEAADLRKTIVEARKKFPKIPEAYWAEYLLNIRDLARRSRIIEEGIKAHPDHPLLVSIYGDFLYSVGRLAEAVERTKRAAALSPLSPDETSGYINMLGWAGRFDQARAELENAERKWPGARNLVDARWRFHLRYGDPEEALRITRSGVSSSYESQEDFLIARIDPTPANIERAIADAKSRVGREPRATGQLIGVFAEFGREEDIFAILEGPKNQDISEGGFDVFFRPSSRRLRQDRRFMKAAQKYGLVDYWQNSGKWPDFCFEPDLPYDCKAEAAKLS